MEYGVKHAWRIFAVAVLIIAGCTGTAETALGQSNRSPDAATVQRDSSSERLPDFDVVSIKPYGRYDSTIGITTTADSISVTGMPLHMIVREALGVTSDRLLGEPAWVNNRYDFYAKISSGDIQEFKGLTSQQRWAMFLPVLEDRCQLKFHHETRKRTVYVLVVAKGGTKLQPSKPEDARAKTGRRQSETGRDSRGIRIAVQGATMASIVRMISLAVGSTVVDETGLKGTYDYEIEYAAEQTLNAPTPPAADGSAPGYAAPSIFTALKEQLGLKLEAKKRPVDVIVIDRLKPPSPN